MHFALNSIAKLGEIRWRPSDVSYALLCGYEESLLPQVERDRSDEAYRKMSKSDGSDDAHGSPKVLTSGGMPGRVVGKAR